MVKTPKRAQIPPMNLPNPEMGVEVPGETQMRKDTKLVILLIKLAAVCLHFENRRAWPRRLFTFSVST